MIRRCESCGKIFLGKMVCPSCGHVNTGLVTSMKAKDQEKFMNEVQRSNIQKQDEMMRSYRSNLGKVKAPAAQGSGGEESSPLKFFGALIGLAVICFIFFKPQSVLVSGWIESNVSTPGFLGKEVGSLSLLTWIVILVISAGVAGMLMPLTLPAMGILAGVIVVFMLLVWPIIHPMVSGMLDTFFSMFNGSIFSGGGGQVNELDAFSYQLNKVTDSKWDLVIERSLPNEVPVKIESVYIMDDSERKLVMSDYTTKGSQKETVNIDYKGQIYSDDYTIFVILSYGQSVSLPLNFEFLEEKTKSDSGEKTPIKGPMDIKATVRPESFVVGDGAPYIDVSYIIDMDNRNSAFDEDAYSTSGKVTGKAKVSRISFSPQGGSTYFNSGSCKLDGEDFSGTGPTFSWSGSKDVDGKSKLECEITYSVPSQITTKKTVQNTFGLDYEYVVSIGKKFQKD